MKFNLTLARPNTDETVVQLIAFINGRRFKTGTGVTVPTKAWDKANQRIKTGTSKNLIANGMGLTASTLLNLSS